LIVTLLRVLGVQAGEFFLRVIGSGMVPHRLLLLVWGEVTL
jgi:hypothetical protein